MRRPLLLLLLVAIATSPACSGGTAADTGIEAWLRVDGAQFFAGPMPDGTGPAVASVSLVSNDVRAGQIDKSLSGALEPGSSSVALMLDGDRGYWVLPAGTPSVASPTFPSFTTSLSFAIGMPGGSYTLDVRAVDDAGRFGPLNTDSQLTVTAFGTPPPGLLVFTLTWDTESDLDLHVVDPTGAEIFARNMSSYVKPPPGQQTDPNAYLSGGILDFDSNASCLIDGRRQEDVAWTETPPNGRYIARVDTFSLCGQVSAHWTVRAYSNGVVVAEAQGSSFDSDTRQPHDRGAGVKAIELNVP